MSQKIIILLVVVAVVIVLLTVSCSSLERKLLFYPTHRPADGALAAWSKGGRLIGSARIVESPRNVWLMLHGNGGQADDRIYALPHFSPQDSVYILEYPGYGTRPGKPSQKAFNQAAQEAYLLLRESFPRTPVCVMAESIGSGPASLLTRLDRPPDKLVLVVTFEKLSLVAKEHFSSLLVGLLLSDDWDNVKALAGYKGPVEVYGAAADDIIPVKHALALAAGVPSAKFILIEGGHNEWAQQPQVKFRNP